MNTDEIQHDIRRQLEETLGQGPVIVRTADLGALCDEVDRLTAKVAALKGIEPVPAEPTAEQLLDGIELLETPAHAQSVALQAGADSVPDLPWMEETKGGSDAG